MKKKIYIYNYSLLVTLCCLFTISSCNGIDDPPQINLTNETVYYIIGEVYSEEKALEGVTVKIANGSEVLTDANGSFKFKLLEKGEYKVSFSKNGYVTVSSNVLFNSEANVISTRFLNQSLVKKNEPIRVEPDKDTEINIESAGVSLIIPAGALNEATDISVTPYFQENNLNTYIYLLSLNIEPYDLKFNKPLKLFFSKSMGENYSYFEVKHLVSEDGVLKDEGIITYNSEKEGYEVELKSFSNHMIAIPININTTALRGNRLGHFETNNINGSSDKMSDVFSFYYLSGWGVEGGYTLYDWLNINLPAQAKPFINNYIAEIMGALSLPGGNQATSTLGQGGGGQNVSAGWRIAYDVYQEYEYLLPYTLYNSTIGFPITVPLVQFTGFEIVYAYDHHGGVLI